MSLPEVASITPVSDIFSAYDPLTAKLLHTRGITTIAEAELFLKPDYDRDTHDPFLLPDMENAVDRILLAIKNNERIVIWSDYDTDGIPGAVILHDTMKAIGYENFENYIPHRIKEGFGLNSAGVAEVAERGAKLIITIDCGITDREPVKEASALGIDTIITDHHLPSGDIPAAYAIVNPKVPGSTYPFPMLCGAAVAWKLALALVRKGEFKVTLGFEKWLLDMAGIATLSDMVPLHGENRVIARYGLVVLRKSRRPGIQKLCRKLKINQSYITEDDVGFMIAPRINAASRMGIPGDAMRMLATSDESEAGVLVDHLDKINNERKGHVAAMAKEAKGKLLARDHVPAVIVLGNPAWKPSLLGLVANTLATEYKRPVFLWGREDGEIIKGSCRSDGVTNLVSLMGAVRDVFIDAGGHAFSGGFSCTNENVLFLEEKLVGAFTALPPRAPGTEEKALHDAELALSEVNERTVSLLARMAPFGEGNPKPVFLFRDCVIEKVKLFGKAKEHLSLMLKDGPASVEAIAFFKDENSFTHVPTEGGTVAVAGCIEKSFFGGRPSLRIRIIDLM